MQTGTETLSEGLDQGLALLATPHPTASLAMWMPGPMEWAAIVIIGLLLFGRRLPEVGRNVGKAIVEFKKGIKDVKEEVDAGMADADRTSTRRESARLSEPSQDYRPAEARRADADDRRVSRSDTVVSGGESI